MDIEEKNNMETSRIREKIFDLWEKYRGDPEIEPYLELVPQVPARIHPVKGAFVFVGINPSFSHKWFLKLSKNIGDKDKETASLLRDGKGMDKLYKWRREKMTDGYLERLERIEAYSIESYGYFSKARRIATECELEFLATDLFLMRITAQRKIRKIIYADSKKTLTDFAMRQIEIFRDTLEAYRPRIILVGNALASDIIKKYFKLEGLWDKEVGTYVFQVAGRRVPIFLSGMLSGGALDTHSMRRLEWQIKRCHSLIGSRSNKKLSQ